MVRFSILAVAIIIIGCASGYQQFYKPMVDSKTLSDVELLKPGEHPKIFGTDDFKRDTLILRSKMYIPIGSSSFNGRYEDETKVAEQAQRIGATLVLIKAKYTNTQTTTTPLFLPKTSTTYQSGSVYSGKASGGYSGTSTTVETEVVPITTQERRYDQGAIFFVKSTKKPRFGVALNDLSNDQRVAIERNAGAVVVVVVEDTPAFFSNVLPGDILIKINDSDIVNAKHARELMSGFTPSADSAMFTVIRKGKEQTIKIKLNGRL
jgi:C-terminal processing protease CtpA/Prc